MIPPFLAAVALAFLAQPAFAQGSTGGLFDTLTVEADQPVEVSADELEVFEAESRALFRGNVHAAQGTLVIQADHIELRYTVQDAGGRTIEWIQAGGSVHFGSGTTSARGDAATYDLVGQIVTIEGNVVLEREGTLLRGNRFRANLNDGTSHMEGGASGRVRATFSVESNEQ